MHVYELDIYETFHGNIFTINLQINVYVCVCQCVRPISFLNFPHGEWYVEPSLTQFKREKFRECVYVVPMQYLVAAATDAC